MKSQPLCAIKISLNEFSSVNRRNFARPAIMQRGVVLFFTLIALLAMSLAAVALIRSVDTSALISGNLAFKQTVISSSDFAIRHAMAKLAALRDGSTLKIDDDAAHPLNQTDLANNPGYYSSLDLDMDMTANSTWNTANGSISLGKDASGNEISYIIQRMCRTPNVKKTEADCLVTAGSDSGDSNAVNSATSVCDGCGPSTGKPAEIRITVKTTGSRNSISYVQGFVY
jgi:type IV pilus assembly protein PilX